MSKRSRGLAHPPDGRDHITLGIDSHREAAMTPARIQRRRSRGWKMPPNTVYVGRPTRWGNPFKVGERDSRSGGVLDASTAVERFTNALVTGRLGIGEIDVIRCLRGKNLACFCRLDQPCHGDVLLELANK